MHHHLLPQDKFIVIGQVLRVLTPPLFYEQKLKVPRAPISHSQEFQVSHMSNFASATSILSEITSEGDFPNM